METIRKSDVAVEHRDLEDTHKSQRRGDEKTDRMRLEEDEAGSRQESRGRAPTAYAAKKGQDFRVLIPSKSAFAEEFQQYSGIKISNKPCQRKSEADLIPLSLKQQRGQCVELVQKDVREKTGAKKEALLVKFKENIQSNELGQLVIENLANFYDIAGEDSIYDSQKSQKSQAKLVKIVKGLCGDQESCVQAITECMSNYLQIFDETNGLKLNTTETFVDNIKQVEKLCRYSEAMVNLLEQYSSMHKNLDQKQLKRVKDSFKVTKPLTEYYYLRADIIKNKYYQRHFDSELSRTISDENSAQENELAVMLTRMEFMTDKESIFQEASSSKQHDQIPAKASSEDWFGINPIRSKILEFARCSTQKKIGAEGSYAQKMSEEHSNAERLQNEIDRLTREIEAGAEDRRAASGEQRAQPNAMTAGAVEQKKIEREELEKELKTVTEKPDYKKYQRLQGENYHVYGEVKKSTMPLIGDIASLQEQASAQGMKIEDFNSMIDTLSEYPHTTYSRTTIDEEQGRAALLNLDGLVRYTLLIRRHMEHLSRKYGTWLETASLKDMTLHWQSIQDDFANVQEMAAVVQYLKGLKDTLLDAQSTDDQRLCDLVSYYSTTFRIKKTSFIDYGNGTIPSEAEYQQASVVRDTESLNIARRVTRGMPAAANFKLKYKDYCCAQSEEERAEQDEARRERDALMAYPASGPDMRKAYRFEPLQPSRFPTIRGEEDMVCVLNPEMLEIAKNYKISQETDIDHEFSSKYQDYMRSAEELLDDRKTIVAYNVELKGKEGRLLLYQKAQGQKKVEKEDEAELKLIEKDIQKLQIKDHSTLEQLKPSVRQLEITQTQQEARLMLLREKIKKEELRQEGPEQEELEQEEPEQEERRKEGPEQEERRKEEPEQEELEQEERDEEQSEEKQIFQLKRKKILIKRTLRLIEENYKLLSEKYELLKRNLKNQSVVQEHENWFKKHKIMIDAGAIKNREQITSKLKEDCDKFEQKHGDFLVDMSRQRNRRYSLDLVADLFNIMIDHCTAASLPGLLEDKAMREYKDKFTYLSFVGFMYFSGTYDYYRKKGKTNDSLLPVAMDEATFSAYSRLYAKRRVMEVKQEREMQ